MNTLSLPGASRFLLMGTILILLGALAVASPAVAGTAVVYVIGGMLLLAGVVQVVHGLRSTGCAPRAGPRRSSP